MTSRWAAAVLVALGLVTAPAFAQPRPKMKGPGFRVKGGAMRPDALRQFTQLSPEERRAALDKLPPERRAIMEQRLQQWEKLTPEQRKRLEDSYARFQEMSPEKQQEVRHLFRRFGETFAPARRPAARAAIRRLREASAEDRPGILNSTRFRNLFNEEERKLIEQMATELPEPD